VYSSYPGHVYNAEAPYVIGAFDLKTGAPRWRRWIDAEVNSTPVSDGKHLYVATKAGTLYQFTAREGDIVAVHKNRVTAPPVLTAEAVIFGRDQDRRADNDMLATSRILFPHLEGIGRPNRGYVKPQPRPLVARYGLYTIEHGVVVATNRKTGRRMWQQRLSSEEPADVPSPMLYAGKSILLATSGGNVLRIDPDTGAVLDAFVLEQGPIASQPIAVDGWLYAGTKQGALVAFDTGHPELTGWEMLGGGPDRRGSADEEGS
jgi:outer membrane protein assembly factor BamB